MEQPPSAPSMSSAPSASGSFFGAPSSQQPAQDAASLSEQVMSSIRRVRMLEERYTLLHRKVQVLEQNALLTNRRFEDDIKKISGQVQEIKSDVADIKSTVKMMAKELSQSANKQDVDMLKKYIGMWEPLNFVTRKELQQSIEDALESLRDEKQ